MTFSPTSASVTVATTNADLFTVTVANSSGVVISDPLERCGLRYRLQRRRRDADDPGTNAVTGQDTVSYTAGATATTCVLTVTEADADASGSVDVTQTAVATSVTVSAVPSWLPPEARPTSRC